MTSVQRLSPWGSAALPACSRCKIKPHCDCATKVTCLSSTTPSRDTPIPTLDPASKSDNFRGHATRSKVSLTATALQTYYFISKRQISRRAQKKAFEAALKELAIHRLADIWEETSYVIHSAPSSSWMPRDTACSSIPVHCHTAAQQLPSPLTTITHTVMSQQHTLSQPPSMRQVTLSDIPLDAFVYELLRRVETVWPVLQIALCYLDAAKPKVQEAIAEAKQGEGLQNAEAVLAKLFELGTTTSSTSKHTVPSTPSAEAGWTPVTPADSNICKVPPVPLTPIPPPPLPSALLCPCRMFIAALTLATKFIQDGSYSNSAWAKILGLDARLTAHKIGRCERALGEALEWRLWIGKGTVDAAIASHHKFSHGG